MTFHSSEGLRQGAEQPQEEQRVSLLEGPPGGQKKTTEDKSSTRETHGINSTRKRNAGSASRIGDGVLRECARAGHEALVVLHDAGVFGERSASECGQRIEDPPPPGGNTPRVSLLAGHDAGGGFGASLEGELARGRAAAESERRKNKQGSHPASVADERAAPKLNRRSCVARASLALSRRYRSEVANG